jgi:hypothetical protein
MASPIDHVLTLEDITKVKAIESDMQDISSVKLFIESVPHLECRVNGDDIETGQYESLRSPFLYSVPFQNEEPVKRVQRREDEKNLYKLRKNLIRRHNKKRWEILKEELGLRVNEISSHRYYLGEELCKRGVRADYDTGIVMASACWLAEYSVEWYTLCMRQYKKAGFNFEFKGMERGVDILAPDKNGNEKHYVLVMRQGFTEEERAAQTASVLKVVKPGEYSVDAEKAKKARDGLNRLETEKVICVLEGKHRKV